MSRIIEEDINCLLEQDISYKNFYNKTVLISGANGYVPSYFVHLFLKLNETDNSNIKVLALCRNYERASKTFFEYLKREDFKLIIQDVCNPISLDEPINVFIHAASPAGIRKRHEDPVNTFLANVKGAENMLELARNNPCDYFLFLSSVDVYGKLQTNNRITEEQSGYLDPLNVRNVYSCAKRAAETLCIAYKEKYGLPIYIVRPFQIIGPGPDLDDGRLHIDFVSQVLKGNTIVLKSDGNAIRSFMYITDAIKAMFYVMLKGNSGEAYNIVSEQGELSVKELAEVVANNVVNKKVRVVFEYEHRNDIEVTSALSVVIGDSSKIRKIGWECDYSVEQGTARMMQYYGIEVPS